MSKKVKDVVIDADHILFNVTESRDYKDGLNESYALTPKGGKVDMTVYQNHFDRIVQDYITIAEVESICYGWTIGKIRVIMSDHRNFRYDLYPEYKKDRPKPPKLRKKLKKWAMKKYHYEPNTEADDVVAYYVREGALGFTTDKDLFKGVEGLWFNCHYMHKCWIRTYKAEAEFFFKQQILGGDLTDGIPSLDGIALIKAKKLMDKYGDGYDVILEIFKNPNLKLGKEPRPKAYSKKYMVTMARLVCMSQWTPENGIRLWEIPNVT